MKNEKVQIVMAIIGIIAITLIIITQNQLIIKNGKSRKQESSNNQEKNSYIEDNIEQISNIGIPTPMEEVYTINHEFERYRTIEAIINNYINSSNNVRSYLGNFNIEENKKYKIVSEIYVVEAIDTTYNYFEISDGSNSKYGVIIIDELEGSYQINTTYKNVFDRVKGGTINFKEYEEKTIPRNKSKSIKIK